jgi:tyrosyl-tRNA synthetase
VVNYLRYFTFLEQAEIEELGQAVQTRPEERAAQRKLGQVMTETAHGPTALGRAEQATQALFGGDIRGLPAADIQDIFAEVPSSDLPKTQLEGAGLGIVDLLTASGLSSSKGDARRSIADGGSTE